MQQPRRCRPGTKPCCHQRRRRGRRRARPAWAPAVAGRAGPARRLPLLMQMHASMASANGPAALQRYTSLNLADATIVAVQAAAICAAPCCAARCSHTHATPILHSLAAAMIAYLLPMAPVCSHMWHTMSSISVKVVRSKLECCPGPVLPGGPRTERPPTSSRRLWTCRCCSFPKVPAQHGRRPGEPHNFEEPA